MKPFFKLLLAASLLTGLAVSCFDESAVMDKIDGLDSRLSALEEQMRTANDNITGLQTIATALMKNLTVISVTEVDGGYKILFSDGTSATVRGGSDGTSGSTPVIGVKQDTDGKWYWTVNGSWLLNDKNEKMPVTGEKGDKGDKGDAAVAPQLKIEKGNWYLSTDGGATWTELGKATGEDGDAWFKDVKVDEDYVYLTLADGTVLKLLRSDGPIVSVAVIPDYNDGSVKAGAGLFTIRFNVEPASSAPSLLDLANDCFTLKAVYTLTKAEGDIITLPIHKREVEDGILTITTTGEDLAAEFASNKLGVNAALFISDEGFAVNSGYFQLWPRNEYMGHEYVDLGLESGNMWADGNLGSKDPSDPGNFYAWGETKPKDHYSWDNYIWCNGTEDTIFKYCDKDGAKSYKDYNYEDDPIRAAWGGEWRTPTVEDWEELLDTDNYTWTWTQLNGTWGYSVSSKKKGYEGQSIFLPATGFIIDDVFHPTVVGAENHGFDPQYPNCIYWSSELWRVSYEDARILVAAKERYSTAWVCPRYCGLVASRPVLGKYEAKNVTGVSIAPGTLTLAVGMTRHLVAMIVPEDADNPKVTWTSSNPGVASVTEDGTVTALSLGEATITVKTVDGGYTATCTVTVKDESELGPKAVDLGLPSGVMWANMNVGATSPEDPGDYFAWGETEPYYLPGHALDNPCTDWKPGKNGYRDASYKWITGEYGEYTKYCRDDKAMSFSVFNYEDDAARANWGGEWRTPTVVEMHELLDNCRWSFETVNGNTFARGTSKINGNSIIIPAAGYRTYQSLKLYGEMATFMTTWLMARFVCYTIPTVKTKTFGWTINNRSEGAPVRPVLGKEKHIPVTGITPGETDIKLIVGETYQLSATVQPSNASEEQYLGWISADETIAKVDTFHGLVTAVSPGVTEVEVVVWKAERYVSATCKVTVLAPPEPDYVDMGLSVRWAKCNVGAKSETDFGDYFAWGETEPYYQDGYAYSPSPLWKPGKEIGYYWPSYRWCNGDYNLLNKYNTSGAYGPVVDNITTLTANDDAATVIMGDNWRTPTLDEWKELLNPNNCHWECTSIQGVPGYTVTSYKTGNYIFLPSAGCRDEDRLSDPASDGTIGYYWSSSLSDIPSQAKSLFFVDENDGGGIFIHDNDRCYGYSVRAICE